MRVRTLVLATVLLWPVSVSSQQARFFAAGNDLFRFCSAGVATSEGLCNGYVAGVVDFWPPPISIAATAHGSCSTVDRCELGWPRPTGQLLSKQLVAADYVSAGHK
jgi:hypothetical protein